jgi:hypothetical protein
MFAVIVESREMRSGAQGNPIITREGERFWALVEPEGWVEATSARASGSTVPGAAKTFQTRAAAERFAERWKGHPWWCSPNGKYEIVEVAPRYVRVRDGYTRVAPPVSTPQSTPANPSTPL